MKKNNVSPRCRATRTDAAQRAQLLAAFDRSGLSGADFARQQGVHYTTFCGWRQRRDRGPASPAFVQVELTPPPPSAERLRAREHDWWDRPMAFTDDPPHAAHQPYELTIRDPEGAA